MIDALDPGKAFGAKTGGRRTQPLQHKTSSARIFSLVLVTAASLQLCGTARAQLPGDPPAAAIRKSTSRPADQPHGSTPDKAWGITLLQRTGVLDQDIEALNAKLRRRHPHRTTDQLADLLIQQAALRSGLAGAVAALPGIIPYAGIPLRIAAMVPEYVYLFREQAILVLRLAELYGNLPAASERGSEILEILASATGLPDSETTAGAYKKVVGLRALAYAATRGVASVVERSSMMRGVMASAGVRTAAKAVPFLGVFTSSGFDYLATRLIGQKVKKLYEQRSCLDVSVAGESQAAPNARAAGSPSMSPARRAPVRGMTDLLGATGS